MPRPLVFTRGSKRVKIGTPVYVYDVYDVKIDCNIVNGTPPVHIRWYRNGIYYRYGGNILTITAPSNGDRYRCRANTQESVDIEETTIYVEYG